MTTKPGQLSKQVQDAVAKIREECGCLTGEAYVTAVHNEASLQLDSRRMQDDDQATLREALIWTATDAELENALDNNEPGDMEGVAYDLLIAKVLSQ